MAYADAFQRGGDVGKLTGHEVNALAGSIPPQAHQAFAAGAGTALADRASQYASDAPNGDVANAVRKMIGDDTKQQALSGIVGDTGDIRSLLNRLEYEHQGHLTWQGAEGNSATPARQAIDADLNGIASIPFSSKAALGHLVNFVSSHAVPQYQKDVKRRIGEIVTASDPQSVGGALQAIHDQAHRDQAFGDLLHKAGVGATVPYAYAIAPRDPADLSDHPVGQGDYRGY
jgi:hypothetical protein